MNGVIVIPGPEIVVLFGVHVPVLSTIFGIGGVLLGHLLAPVTQEPLGFRRHMLVVVGGWLVSLAITITTGQAPLLVLGWSIGIGFSGLALFATLGGQAVNGVHRITETIIEAAAERISAGKDTK